MKIGIMTFHGASNYGAVLQAFALQTHLQTMGHDPFFINFHYGPAVTKGFKRWVGKTPSSTIAKIGNHFKNLPFNQFREKYLNIGQKEYLSLAQLNDDPPEADVYICGSDQIWNPHLLLMAKDEHAFWLDFGDRSIPRISYAASFGVDSLDQETVNRYSEYCKKINRLSVREQSGICLLAMLGNSESEWVPDPTLLLPKDKYTEIEESQDWDDRAYLFLCNLAYANNDKAEMLGNRIAQMLDFSIYNVFNKSILNRLFHLKDPSPSQWIWRIRHSSFVVTDSFHVTLFSLLFHKPFIVLKRTGLAEGMNERLFSLLGVVKLKDRMLDFCDETAIRDLCQKEIDWNDVDKKLLCYRDAGDRYLSESLQMQTVGFNGR